MNSPELDKIENTETVVNPPAESRINFVGVLLVGLTVNLGAALIYINTLPDAQHPTLDKSAQIHNQKP